MRVDPASSAHIGAGRYLSALAGHQGGRFVQNLRGTTYGDTAQIAIPVIAFGVSYVFTDAFDEEVPTVPVFGVGQKNFGIFANVKLRGRHVRPLAGDHYLRPFTQHRAGSGRRRPVAAQGAKTGP